MISLAILTDDRPGFRPASFEDSRWGFRLRMDFPRVKLLDFRGREKELRANPSPFSVVVLAHLLKLKSPGVPSLYRSKLRHLVQELKTATALEAFVAAMEQS